MTNITAFSGAAIGFVIAALVTFAMLVVAAVAIAVFAASSPQISVIAIAVFGGTVEVLVASYVLIFLVSYLAARAAEAFPGALLLVSFVYCVLFIGLTAYVELLLFAGVVAALLFFLLAGAFLFVLCALHLVAVAVAYVLSATLNDTYGRGEDVATRGLLIGTNAWLNLFWSAVFYSPFFLALPVPIWLRLLLCVFFPLVFCIVTFRAAVNPANANTKESLGWFVWLLPMSWPVIVPGCIFFFLNHLGHLLFSWIPGFPFAFEVTIRSIVTRTKTTTILTEGGIASNANLIDTAYNMGSFVFVDSVSSPVSTRTEEHETGHQFNLGAFGYAFHYFGFVDELFRGASAYAEELAEGNVTTPAAPTAPMWL